MNDVALATFSSFDVGKYVSERTQPERFYHGFVLGLLIEIRDRYDVRSNRESGFGRYDVMLLPKSKRDNAIILEFKVREPDSEKTLEDTVESALDQIIEMCIRDSTWLEMTVQIPDWEFTIMNMEQILVNRRWFTTASILL